MAEDKYIHGMDWETQDASFINLKNYRKYQYNLISKYVGNTILEVGSGDRSFTNQILLEKPQLESILSIEPSAFLFKNHKNSFKFPNKVDFQSIDLFDLDVEKTGLFDSVIFIHVLEHIEDDRKALDTASKFVKKGGHVLVEVPALPFLFSAHDEMLGHYRRYTKKMMRKAIDTEKYKVMKLWYQDPIGELGSFIFFKMKKIKLGSDDGQKLVKNQGGVYDKYIIPFEQQLEKFITFPFGLSLTVVLEKK